jgi:hypothetical protein
MKRRRFLRAAGWFAAGTTLGVAGCSSDATQSSPTGQEADNKQVLDSAAANDKAAGNNPRRKARNR